MLPMPPPHAGESSSSPPLRFDRFELQMQERRLLVDGRATVVLNTPLTAPAP